MDEQEACTDRRTTEENDVSNGGTTASTPEYVRMILTEKVRIVLTQTGYDENRAIRILRNNGWDCSDAIKRYICLLYTSPSPRD